MLNGNGVERFEAMNEAKGLAIFLNDTEPTRSIRRVRRFVDSGVDLPPDDFADFVIDARRDGDIALYPRGVRDYWEFDGRKEVGSKGSALRVVPSEHLVVETHEVVDDVAFGGPKEGMG